MNKRLKYLLYAVFCCIFAAAVTLAAILGSGQRREITCTGLEVEFRDSLKFVCEDDVRGWLDGNYGTYVGSRLDSIRLWEMEEHIRSRSAVDKCEAWTTDDGTLHISISQRTPVVRFEKGDIGFYADDRGFIFPLHRSYTAPVPVVRGALPLSEGGAYKGEARTPEEREWIAGVLELLDFVSASRIWNGKVKSIDVNQAGDIVLTLQGAAKEDGSRTAVRERFILGKPCDIADKFARMEKFFTHIQPEKGEGYYRTVNLKYNGQIICRRNDT